MEPTVQPRQPTVLVGLTTTITKTAGDPGDNPRRIGELWRKLDALLPPDALFLRRGALMEPPSGALGESEEYFGGLLWPAAEPTPPGLLRRELPAGDYLACLHQGPISGLGQTLARIYGQLLPALGRPRGQGPDLALYLGVEKPMEPGFQLELWVPLGPPR